MNEVHKQLIEDFIKNNKLCVFSTISADGFPQAATVAYSEVGTNLIISTSSDTRKYKNILKNPKSSITIGWDDNEFKTIQMDGEATPIKEEFDKYEKIHLAKHPSSAKYFEDKNNVLILFKPTWIRYSDLIDKDIFVL